MSAATSALADQIAAASREAGSALFTTAQMAGLPVTSAHPLGWVRDRLDDLHLAVTMGRETTCDHVGSAPRVVLAAAWRPGWIGCAACAWRVLREVRGSMEDRICDACQRVVETIHPNLVAAGPVLFAYGLCPPCQRQHAPSRVTTPRRAAS